MTPSRIAAEDYYLESVVVALMLAVVKAVDHWPDVEVSLVVVVEH